MVEIGGFDTSYLVAVLGTVGVFPHSHDLTSWYHGGRPLLFPVTEDSRAIPVRIEILVQI